MISWVASGDDFAADAARLAGAVEQIPGEAAPDAGDIARTRILDSISGRRGTLSLSGVPGRLDVTARVTGGAGRATVRLQPANNGLWEIADGTTRAHPIRARRGSALAAPPHGPFASVRHPGTSGPNRWPADCASTDADVDRAIEAVADRAFEAV